jgi:DNA-binding beta-propeller fold protein YncE
MESGLKIIFLIIISFVSGICSQIEIEELGRFGGTGSNQGLFKNPSAIDVTVDGKVLVCDRGNNRIQVFDLKGNFIKDIGGFGSLHDQFDEPLDIWARSTLNIFVADYNNQRVQRYDRNLNFISAFYSNEGNDDRFQFLEVLSVAYSTQGDLFILEAGENKIIKFQRKTAQVAFGFFESGVGELNDPVQIDITSNQKIIVSDAGNSCINIYDYFGTFLNNIKVPGLKNPNGLVTDNSARIYATDTGSKKIYIFTEEGELIKDIESISGKKLNNPVDIALFKMNQNRYKAFLIDDNEVIVFTIKFNQSGE